MEEGARSPDRLSYPFIRRIDRLIRQALLGSPGVAAWSAEAVQETDFVAEDEPYATSPH